MLKIALYLLVLLGFLSLASGAMRQVITEFLAGRRGLQDEDLQSCVRQVHAMLDRRQSSGEQSPASGKN
ncbi:MAG: hypothetical protein RIQ52_467 [Pseudomonadota bacterium]|jgi:hypothetical protein